MGPIALRTLGLGLLVGALVSAAARAAPGNRGGQERFEEARSLLRAGHAREATLDLLAIVRTLPRDPIAPEALFQAAKVFEENLEDPETADRLYAELSEHYPQSRLAPRARALHAELSAGLRTGAAALREFNDIVRTFRPAGLQSTIARLTALLREHPDFALADRATYLLGSAYQDKGQDRIAERTLLDLVARHPSSPWRPPAEQLLGEIMLTRHDFRQARTYFARLRRYPATQWQVAAEQGEAACDRERLRFWLAIAAVAYLLLAGPLSLLRGRRHLWPPPFEVYYYVPVAGFLYGVALLSIQGALRKAVLLVALGGAGLVWLSASAAQAAASRRPARPGRWRPLAGLLCGVTARALGVAALAYLIVYGNKLINVILYTLHDGPEG